MRFFVCLGFLLAATAAQAQTYTTVVNSQAKTVTTTGPNATATTVQTSNNGTTRTYTTTITKNSGGYQPMGGSGYMPTGMGFGGGDIMGMLGGSGGADMMAMIPQLMRLANVGGGHRRRHR